MRVITHRKLGTVLSSHERRFTSMYSDLELLPVEYSIFNVHHNPTDASPAPNLLPCTSAPIGILAPTKSRLADRSRLSPPIVWNVMQPTGPSSCSLQRASRGLLLRDLQESRRIRRLHLLPPCDTYVRDCGSLCLTCYEIRIPIHV